MQSKCIKKPIDPTQVEHSWSVMVCHLYCIEGVDWNCRTGHWRIVTGCINRLGGVSVKQNYGGRCRCRRRRLGVVVLTVAVSVLSSLQCLRVVASGMTNCTPELNPTVWTVVEPWHHDPCFVQDPSAVLIAFDALILSCSMLLNLQDWWKNPSINIRSVIVQSCTVYSPAISAIHCRSSAAEAENSHGNLFHVFRSCACDLSSK